jgi:hypothetical protein
MVKKRPAITLFITLAVIVAMLSLVGIVFGYLSKARIKAEDKAALIESNLIYADASNAVSKFVGKKPSVSTLKNIYQIPLTVNEQKGPFRLLVACSPARAAIPISWLREDGGAKREQMYSLASMVLDEIALKNNIKDINRLKAMLSEAIANKFSINFGEAARLKRAKDYFGWIDFKKVLDDYYLKEGDGSVYKPNWRYFFSFGKEYQSIDGNFLSAKLISIIFNIDEQIVKEDFKSGYLKKFILENGLDLELYNSKIFAKGAVVALTCNANYSFGKGSYAFKFNYTDGKVEGFEFIQ